MALIECSTCSGAKTQLCNAACGEGMLDCGACAGTANAYNEETGEYDGPDCEECDGNGEEECSHCDGDGTIDCEDCSGSGTEEVDEDEDDKDE